MKNYIWCFLKQGVMQVWSYSNSFSNYKKKLFERSMKAKGACFALQLCDKILKAGNFRAWQTNQLFHLILHHNPNIFFGYDKKDLKDFWPPLNVWKQYCWRTRNHYLGIYKRIFCANWDLHKFGTRKNFCLQSAFLLEINRSHFQGVSTESIQSWNKQWFSF